MPDIPVTRGEFLAAEARETCLPLHAAGKHVLRSCRPAPGSLQV